MPATLRALRILAPILALGACSRPAGPRADPDGTLRVEANDNRVAAGDLRGDTLTLRLVVRMARWYPEADDGPSVDVAAFAEEGRAPSVPAPLIRVRSGTVIDVTVRNELSDSTLTVHGLQTRPAPADDSVSIAPGASHRFVFAAGEPGTYLYLARPGVVDYDEREREQLAGALVVDPQNGPVEDRVFVMNIWGEPVDSTGYRNAVAINGRSWPATEALTATVGEAQRWRVINATVRNHPMHLHGFYFDVESRGDLRADTAYAGARRRKAVTEDMDAFSTMALTWTPDRDGNWLFHCHIAFHVAPDAARLDPPEDSHAHLQSGDAARHMAGLVLGIRVSYPPGASAPARGEPRRLRLFVQEGQPRGNAERALGFVLQRGDAPPAADSVEIPGTTLVVTRGEPTDITVLNRLGEPTGVHWHGLELESGSDGVVGWSGDGTRVAPPIAPGDSFTAHLTMPRTGTFIYHTHLNDLEQLTAGLYGALVVLEPGARFDPATDHVLVAGWDGPTDPPIHVLVNGAYRPEPPLVLEAGASHRFRLVNIGPALRLFYSIGRDGKPATWRALAKDGADLPAHRQVDGPARQRLGVGETADFQFTPAPGEYEIVVEHPQAAARAWVRKLVVR